MDEDDYVPAAAFAEVAENWATIGAALRQAAVEKMRAQAQVEPKAAWGEPPASLHWRLTSWGILFQTEHGKMLVGPDSGIDLDSIMDQLLHPTWKTAGHRPQGNC